MSESPDPGRGSNRTSAPWHLWVVGTIGVLWNGVGVVDNFMIQTDNESYLAAFSAEQLQVLGSLPLWLAGSWSLAVWGGVAGCLLLLLRRRISVTVLLASLLAMTVTGVHNFATEGGIYETGGTSPAFVLLIFGLACGFWVYGRALNQRGLLA